MTFRRAFAVGFGVVLGVAVAAIVLTGLYIVGADFVLYNFDAIYDIGVKLMRVPKWLIATGWLVADRDHAIRVTGESAMNAAKQYVETIAKLRAGSAPACCCANSMPSISNTADAAS